MTCWNPAFFAAVCDDLRQTVHSIALHLDPVIELSRTAGNESSRRAVNGIRECWYALDELLSQVLDLSRADAGAVRPQLGRVEAAPLIHSVALRHRIAAELAGVRIVVRARVDRFVLADSTMLQTVIGNLLDSAIDASPSGAIVAITLRNGSNGWRIQIRDRGADIDLRDQHKINDESVPNRSNAGKPGSAVGLRLALCMRFVALMGGALNVRSQHGRGCCVTITLPRLPSSTSMASVDARLVHSLGLS